MRLSADGPESDITAVVQVLGNLLGAAGAAIAPPFVEADVRLGYSQWAQTYDQPGNPLIALEEQIVRPLLNSAPVGDALDVAAGTGRQALRLAAMGHRVTAVDASPEMLARLHGRNVRILVSDMMALPLQDAAFDLVICSLALTHAPSLGPPLREMARVVRPGGSVIISDIHPLIVALGGQGYYRTRQGETRFVRNQVRWPSQYLASFASAGLIAARCHEPALGSPGGVPHFLESPSRAEDRAARIAFGRLPGAIVWELRRPA
jgi:ubiquinone/menaquinone biosynthesis C-methylase UbiE